MDGSLSQYSIFQLQSSTEMNFAWQKSGGSRFRRAWLGRVINLSHPKNSSYSFFFWWSCIKTLSNMCWQCFFNKYIIIDISHMIFLWRHFRIYHQFYGQTPIKVKVLKSCQKLIAIKKKLPERTFQGLQKIVNKFEDLFENIPIFHDFTYE